MITRFAPSPTGLLHLGHAFSAMTAFDLAIKSGGTFLLRIEDLDRSRVRDVFEKAIFDDLHWLGLTWPEPVMRQSEQRPRYDAALDKLVEQGLIYPCCCTRSDIKDALSAPQEGAQAYGPDGPVYPGTCRGRSMADRTPGDALRLNVRKAMQVIGSSIYFLETGGFSDGWNVIDPAEFIARVGDVILGRRSTDDIAYHLACTLDDAYQGVTHVVRGRDLFDATQIHVVLQTLLGLPTPIYLHHDLVRDANGKRLAKRDDARALSKYRAEGCTPNDLRLKLGR
jgi:glutamyl-Q tRNA(Asp) synthetase